MYIIIEGIDTAGKSTQLDILKQKYPTAIFTKEPGGTVLGETIRGLVLNGEAKSKVAEMFLFLADRAEHIFEIVKQNQDEMIISDRGFLSGISYAQAPLDITISLNMMALNGVIPDKVVILKLSRETLEVRLSQKDNDSIENRGIEYLLDVQSRMIEAIEIINANSEQKIDVLVIDASKSIGEIANDIENFIKD